MQKCSEESYYFLYWILNAFEERENQSLRHQFVVDIFLSRFSGLTIKAYFILFLRPVQDQKSLGWDAECPTDVYCFLSNLQVGHQLHYGGDRRTGGLWARYGGLELVGQGHANWLTNVSLFQQTLSTEDYAHAFVRNNT